MDIEEFKNLKTQMELNIGAVIAEEIDAFKKSTGYTPDDIFVNIQEISSLGKSNKVLSGVYVSVEI